ncbi:hypothetical protein [Flagellimonas allohymeniacidonis]|uniref:Lipoprotein n=1 Tax=Flagellimonas allohymeniacidonis TaxID=2517819 RepID=A0A4Q8QJN5_9FLAO|nr:hypothetical protein [Allomuricauda hymeniacidonis]TAI48963.1 hypothetical protein EW142_03975 [Allomuricauda hymeniacidonis]
MKKLFVMLAVFAVSISCSENEIENPVQVSEEPTATNALGPIVCTGYGIFSNSVYDCGWRRGYEDWVFHYNSVVTQQSYPPCYKIRIVVGSGTVGIKWNTALFAQQIIQQTQNQYQTYYNNLFNNTVGDFNQGKIAGYLAGRGQEPYTANSEDVCP